MNIEPLQHLLVDTKDIECIICYSRYSHITNEAMIISCGHTVCSSCLKNIKECPFCKTEILQNSTKNILLASLLERDSQVKKCVIHKRPVEFYSKDDKKMLCSQCLVEKYQDKYEPVQKIESKIKEIKSTEEKIHSQKEKNKKEILEKLHKGNLNLKRKLDDLYEEKLAFDLANKKRLKKMIDTFTFTEKEIYEHELLAQGLSKYEEDVKVLQESWKNSQEGIIAEQILSASLETKEAIQFYNSKAKQMSKDLVEKERGFEKAITESKKNLCEISKYLFDEISSHFLGLSSDIKFDLKYGPQIARNYLLNTFEEHGILANYQERNDIIELQESTSETALKKFHPQFFDCYIKKLAFSCSTLSDLSFEMLCEILQNVQALSQLAFSIKELTSKQIELISSHVISSKTIQKFSCDIPVKLEIQNGLKESIESLLGSKRASTFCMRLSPHDTVFIDFQQDLEQPLQQRLKEFSLEFIGENPFYNQILQALSPLVPSFTSLRRLKLSFGAAASYDSFLRDFCPVLIKSQSLEELDLGFAEVDLLIDGGPGQRVCDLIIHSKQLRKVSLFLAGIELTENLFYDLFQLDDKVASPGHKLEELSLTIMRCGDVHVQEIAQYANEFPNLKKLALKINRCGVQFEQIAEFLKDAADLKSINSLELAVRDFGELAMNEKRDLEVYRCRLSQYNIPHKIVFEELMSHHLPEYVDIVSEGEDDGEEDGYDEGSEEEAEERVEEVQEEIAGNIPAGNKSQ